MGKLYTKGVGALARVIIHEARRERFIPTGDLPQDAKPEPQTTLLPPTPPPERGTVGLKQEEKKVAPAPGTGCIPCGRLHLQKVAGLLEESLRFARSDGLGHPEVLRRVDLAERELGNMEVIDFHPSVLVTLPPKEKELAELALARGRELRHGLDGLRASSPVEELEKVAALASQVADEYRARLWGIPPERFRQVKDLTRKVQTGEMTSQEAVSQLKKSLEKEPQDG